jgi:hypothetical protein
MYSSWYLHVDAVISCTEMTCEVEEAGNPSTPFASEYNVLRSNSVWMPDLKVKALVGSSTEAAPASD